MMNLDATISSPETLIQVRDLEAGYGKIKVLRGVTIDVKRGEIVAVIGPNGAGKSTLFQAIYGFVKPASGSIRLDGQPIDGRSPDDLLQQGVAYVPQQRTTFPDMTVEGNLRMGAYLVRDRRRVEDALQQAYSLFPRLYDRRNQFVRTMSGGEQRMIEIGRALMLTPRLLMLDEPSAGLAPVIARQIFAAIQTLHRDFDMTIALIEQNARLALEISHRSYVLEDGHNRVQGASADLLNLPEIQRVYLGGAAQP